MFGMIAAMTMKTTLWARGRAQVLAFLHAVRTWPWYDTLCTLRLRFREDRLGLSAGSLTFTTLIALVPLLTVMLAVFTAFPMFGHFQTALQKYFLQSLVPPNISRQVLGLLTQFASKANRVGGAGLIFLMASALSLILTIDRTLNGIWRVRKARPLGRRVLIYWGALTLGPLVLGVSLSLTSYAVSASKGLVAGMPGGVKLVFDIIEFGLMGAAMAALFFYVPNTHVRWKHAVAGALFVAVSFELAKKGLAWYVGSVATYSAIYGAFATLPIFLLWLYLGWVIVLMGAVIAAYAPSLGMKAVRQPDRPGRSFALALAILQMLVDGQREGVRGLSLEDMARRMRADPLQLEPVLEALISIDWIARLDEEGAQRHALLCEPRRQSIAPLVDVLLLATGERVARFVERAGFGGMTLADALASDHARAPAAMGGGVLAHPQTGVQDA